MTYIAPARSQPFGAILDVDDERPPRATIVEPSVWPVTIREGETLRCVAAIESDSGQVDRLLWRAGGVLEASNPSSDLDHTFSGLERGEYDIVLECRGPGGTSRSTRKRTLVVQEFVVEPPPPPPPPPPVGVVTTLVTAHGTRLRVHPDGSVDAGGEGDGPWEMVEIVEVGQ
jgi:hypothetical protein